MMRFFLTHLTLSCVLFFGLVQADVIPARIHKVFSENSVSGRNAKHLVDGSGLIDGSHQVGERGMAWTVVGNGLQGGYDPYVVFDLGAPTDVSGIRIWNFNSNQQVKITDQGQAELSTTRPTLALIGPDKIELLTSVDGKNFTSKQELNLDKAPGTNDYAGQLFKVELKGVRYVKFDIKSTHEGVIFDSTAKNKGKIDKRALTGLSEVQFIAPTMIEYEVASELKATEGGQGATYQVRLRAEPPKGVGMLLHAVPADKSLSLNKGQPGMAATLEFSADNWNQWQTVLIEASDNQIYTVDHQAKILHHLEREGESPRQLDKQVNVSVVENDPEPAPEKLEPVKPSERMDWFADQKYYWFVHWGPSSLAGTEISWSRGAVGVEKYDSLYKQFNPVDFDADEWCKLAKAAGLTTMVFITKHHDGFCMWDTKTTDYNVMNTPYGKDILKELSEACKRHGLRFSLYYSVMDWYHPDWPGYYAGGPGYSLPDGQKPDINRYFDYMEQQITELLTNYGDISLMWWDGTDGRDAFAPLSIWNDEQSERFEALCRKLQPAMVMNNRIGHWNGNDIRKHWWVDRFGDYDSNEMERMKFQKKPWEYTWKLGNQWGYRPNDNYKSTKTMLRDYLIKIVGYNGNFLMNTAPNPRGGFDDVVRDRLLDIGNWLKLHGESIYATRGGPYTADESNWGISTHRDKVIYLHVLNWPETSLDLPSINKEIKNASVLTGGTCRVRDQDGTLRIDVPKIYRKPIDTIIKIELTQAIEEAAPPMAE